MRISKAVLLWYRSIDVLEFELNRFTVLFGKNNVGKTNLLEAMYSILAPQTMPGHAAQDAVARGVRGDGEHSMPMGALVFDLEPGNAFDDEILEIGELARGAITGPHPELFPDLPEAQAAYVGDIKQPGLVFVDPHAYYKLTRELAAAQLVPGESIEEHLSSTVIPAGPTPRPLFLGWEFKDVDSWVTPAILALDPLRNYSKGRTRGPAWVELVDGSEPPGSWRVRLETRHQLDILGTLSTFFLPTFIDGSISAELDVPIQWGATPSVRVYFQETGSDERRSIEESGRGATRWMAIAVQMALHLVVDGMPANFELESMPRLPFSGHVLFVDEPEAHLHPSAVTSVVSWCQRMTKLGFQVIAASHDDGFLRATGRDVMFVKVGRDPNTGHTSARSVPTTSTIALQELAVDVGMHPATVMSLHRAILFVEGPLDEAVLDEYAGPKLDAAGVLIVPIHGTRNLEGLIDGEFTTRLGIKVGILTDATTTETMWDRSNRKRSSEEVKLVRLIQRFEESGQPRPKAFGVAEADLLFALPAEAIRTYLGGPFPDWPDLVKECRTATGTGPSESVDWKKFADENYKLPLTSTDGVRRILRGLDLAGVDLTSIRVAVDSVLAWAADD